ncbi:MAG: T9SS type A sorting domain-containing protein [Bacteroidales bacterium]|nr:T9SS type A sorting domain-containing protein [Bacteroidales bacterium]
MKRVLLLFLLLMGAVSATCFAQNSLPSLNVNVDKLDFGEVPMSESLTKYVRVSGSDLQQGIQVVLNGATDLFSFDYATGWDNLTGGVILVTFAPTPTPTTAPFAYNATLTISSDVKDLVEIELVGAVANSYYFDLGFVGVATPYVFPTNTTISFTGQVMTATGPAGANAAQVDVEIDIFVNGTKRVLTTKTDDNGNISASFEPLPYESGHYVVNCGRVGNNSTTGNLEFDILGFSMLDPGDNMCYITMGEQKTNQIHILNKSDSQSLSNVRVEFADAYTDMFELSSQSIDLDPSGDAYLNYTITGSYPTMDGELYYPVDLKVVSNEDAETKFTIWYYCMDDFSASSTLGLSFLPYSPSITVPAGTSKVMDVMVINTNDFDTGILDVHFTGNVEELLGASILNDTLPSIAPHDTAYISLRFSPAEQISIEGYYVTVEVGAGNYDSFGVSVNVVEETTGTYILDVTDDYTYEHLNKAEDPHVSSAEVTVVAYQSLELMSHGYTDDNGIYTLDNLPEGYYWVHVSADDHHAEYSSIVHIVEGDNNSEVFLQCLPVNYSWIATPGSGDDYTYDLSIEYETTAPVPVITIDHKDVHELDYGQSELFKITVTNHGTVAAYNIQLGFTESSEYYFVPLYDNIDTLKPSASVVIPGTYYRANTAASPIEGDCDVHITAVSHYDSWSNYMGVTTIENRSMPFDLGLPATCDPERYNFSFGYPSVTDPNTVPYSSLGGSEEEESGTAIIKEEFGAPCINALVDALSDCLPESLPRGAVLTALSGATASIASEGAYNTGMLMLDLVSGFVDEAMGEYDGGLWGVKDCLYNAYTELDGCASKDNPIDLQNTINGLAKSTQYYYNEFAFVNAFFSNDSWNDELNIIGFINAFKSKLNSSDGKISDTDAATLAATFTGTTVVADQIAEFIERWNRSVDYWTSGHFVVDGSHTDFIEIDNALINTMIALEDQFIAAGYTDMETVYEESYTNGNILAEQASLSNNSVKKSFAQKAAMVGEKLEESFTIHNGHSTGSMASVGLDFVVKDEGGVDRTDWFEIRTVSMKDITGIDGNGTVAASKDGLVKIEYVPTRAAATTTPKTYYFGGTFTFVDPYTNSTVTHDMYPVPIAVNPGPNLYVDYFVPKAIIGDDPLTTDKIEHGELAELGVRIHNKGAVAASNVTLETAEPIIRDLTDTDILYELDEVRFNDELRAVGLKDVPFGNLNNGQSKVGEWKFVSTQLGRFGAYDSHVIHNSSKGVPDLSLVSHKALHELVRPVLVYGTDGDDVIDFLVNDVPDTDDTPDSLYFSQGGRTAVKPVQNISFDHYVEELAVDPDAVIQITLTIQPSSAGWNYGVIDNPGGDKFELGGIQRNNDNTFLPIQNLWTTPVTLRDGEDPIHENKLHFLDTLPDNQECTYTLTYHLKYDLLKVASLSGIGSSLDHPLEYFYAYFNKPIIDSTLTYEDMILTCNGGPNLMDASVQFTKVSDFGYKVFIPSMTNESGTYELTLSSMHVKDTCGYEGYRDLTVSWTQDLPNYTQTNDLTEGWNWWSPVVNMGSAADFDKLKTALGANASLIKSRNSGFVSYYEGDWYGTLTMLNNSEMYMIDMDAAQTITIDGPVATLSGKRIMLNPGWNWISYPASTSQTLTAAMANLTPSENDIIKSRNIFATYTSSDGWVGDLSTLNPGDGYLYSYHGSGTVEFVYPSTGKEEGLPEKENRTNHWEMAVGSYDLNASLLGVIEIEGVEQREETLAVGAFIGDQCVGQTNAFYVESRDRYFVFLNYFGVSGDEITFRLYNETNGMEYGISETTTVFEPNAVSGTLEEPVTLRFNTVTVPEFYTKHLNLFPNPVKTKEKVKVSMKEGLANGMDVEVLSSLGVLIYKTTVNDDEFELTAPLTQGVYIIKITGNTGVVYYGKLFVE